jgi:hypothetical protein
METNEETIHSSVQNNTIKTTFNINRQTNFRLLRIRYNFTTIQPTLNIWDKGLNMPCLSIFGGFAF